MRFSLRSRMSIIFSLIALASIIGGFLFFMEARSSIQMAKAKGLAYSSLSPIQKRLLDGLVSSNLDDPPQTNVATRSNYIPTSDDGCPQNRGDNIKVNQDCLNITDTDLQGRGQAQNETSIAQDTFNPNHVIATYNDYRRGDSTCGVSYSLNGGGIWTDATLPNGYTRGTAFGGVVRQYWQASGDPSVAWDTKGNAYYSCLTFMRGPGTTNNPDLSSAIYVYRSTGNFGASWNFPGHPVIETSNTNPAVLEDKPYMTVDNHAGSKFQDRIYVTWTRFAADGTAYIFEVHSSDYGQSFSSPVLVSADSSLCTYTFGDFGVPTPHGRCNENQFSDPFIGPDGALYVAYDNFNTVSPTSSKSDNHYQVLLSKSTDGGASFSAP